MTDERPFGAHDEQIHPADPEDRSWNESWFFSYIDLGGGPAGFFRLGLLPNQRRAMLWSFVHVDGRWLGIEESRLAFDDFDVSDGVAYDRWGLRFAWRPDPPLGGARFTFEGSFLERSGTDSGSYVPVSIELTCAATSECVGTGTGDDDRRSPHEARRFEQTLEATGTVTVDGVAHTVRAGAHRDRSWGPREWRLQFTLGDLQGGDRQLYFVGRSFPGLGGGFLRTGSGSPEHLVALDDSLIEHDDDAHTISTGRLHLKGESSDIEVTVRPIAPAVAFDMAHTSERPEHWLYWRTLVEAEVSGWDRPCRGWFETSRYGAS
jgi:hypothetical protein